MSMNKSLTRLTGKILDAGIWMLSHVPVGKNIDLSKLVTDKTDRLLNMPGRLPFFPTAAASLNDIRALVHELHPLTCRKPLIRMGGGGDGGYLVPDDLEGISACFSPGVSTVSAFELDCARRGMRVFMADASVAGPAESHSQFRFIKKFIGSATRGDYVSLEEWVGENSGDLEGDFLLQMDIEGGEYEALSSLPLAMQRRFRIIVVEFHYLDYLFSEPLFKLLSPVFYKIQTTHKCVHIHPNNVCETLTVGDMEVPQMAEFTFLRDDRVDCVGYASQFPHPLDCDNCDKPSVILPRTFYRNV